MRQVANGPEDVLQVRDAAGLDIGQVFPESLHHFLFPALRQFLLQLVQREMNDVVVVQIAPHLLAETQPEAV